MFRWSKPHTDLLGASRSINRSVLVTVLSVSEACKTNSSDEPRGPITMESTLTLDLSRTAWTPASGCSVYRDNYLLVPRTHALSKSLARVGGMCAISRTF